MARRTRTRSDVITIVRDTDVLDEIRVTWENDNAVVRAIYLVPSPDGTLLREARLSGVSPTGFITSVFNDTAE